MLNLLKIWLPPPPLTQKRFFWTFEKCPKILKSKKRVDINRHGTLLAYVLLRRSLNKKRTTKMKKNNSWEKNKDITTILNTFDRSWINATHLDSRRVIMLERKGSIREKLFHFLVTKWERGDFRNLDRHPQADYLLGQRNHFKRQPS